MIEEYQFGHIRISGKDYNHDIEVRWDGNVLHWLRKESHVVDSKDIQRALGEKPDLIVLGTGAYGVARITESARKEIERSGVQLIIDKTGEAIKTFNIVLEESQQEEGERKKVIGLFHLTC